MFPGWFCRSDFSHDLEARITAAVATEVALTGDAIYPLNELSQLI